MIKIGKIIVIVVSLLAASASMMANETADGILKRASKAIKTADGLVASFTMTSGNQEVTGTMKSSGNKFSLVTSATSVWYDGKTLWTYNKKNNETTVTLPTAAEVAEANPMHIVNAYSGNFTVAFAKSQKKGSKTIVLTPKSKKMGYKSVHLTIPDKSSFPSQMVVVPSSGQKITISVTGVKTGQKFSANTFTYPAARYPKAEIVDLR